MADSTAIALPKPLAHLAGRITDVDSHEMIPAQNWVEFFGADVDELAQAMINGSPTDDIDKNSSNIPNFAGDVMEITESVVNVKGARAPGAVDMKRRLDVMNAMGVSRQLMYPTSVGLWAVLLLVNDKFDPHVLGAITEDRAGKAKRWIATYNDWMVKLAGYSDRIRPVPPVYGDTVADLMACTKHLLDNGIRAIMLPAGTLPGGKSPAHPDLEPFWTLLEEARCAVTIHLGGEGQYLEGIREWRNSPVFEGYRSVAEFSTDPWYLNSMHLPAQNFIQTMIVGGVFVRHPELRVGVIELGAYWVGPMMEAMDLWHRNMSAFAKNENALTEPPSTYLRRNIKVSVFSFEDIETYIERYDLGDVLCFSSDYPHVEGGKDMMQVMYDKVERFGPEIVEKFFVTNGAFLLPD